MRRWLTLLGALNFMALAVHAGLSWVEAGAATYAERPHGQVVFYTALGARVADAMSKWTPELLVGARTTPRANERKRVGAAPIEWGDRVRTARRQVTFGIGGDMVQPARFIDLYAAPLIASTLLALGALFLLTHTGVGDDPRTPSSIRRWGTAFAVVMGFALPVLVPDFWLSFAWGRTLWWGGNPYYEVPAAAVQGLPFDAPILKMTYGPLWAVIAWGVALLTRGSVLWGTVLFKVLLVGGWIALLHLVHRLTSDKSPREQSVALVLTGWLPLGVVQVAGDGHNDVFMLLGILGWLLLRQQDNPRWATLALASSVAVKYVSAPLFLLDLLETRVAGTSRATLAQRVVTYLPQGVMAALFWVVVFAPFMRSLGFFAETTAVREGYFFLPADAVKAIGTLTGRGLRPLAFAVMGIFPLVTLSTLWAYWRSPSRAALHMAVAGIMCSVLFVAAGHVWPWYVLWLSVPAALLPLESRLARWSTGVLLTAPFPLLYWTAWPHSTLFRRYELPSLAAYGLALVWLLVAWRLFQRTRAPGSARAVA